MDNEAALDYTDHVIVTPRGEYPLTDPDGWMLTPSGLAVPAASYKTITGVDLFAGAGGFSLGLLQAGVSVVAAVDDDIDCFLTYMSNLGANPCEVRYVSPEDEEKLETGLQKRMERGRRRRKNKLLTPQVSGQYRPPDLGPPGWEGVPVYWFGDISRLDGARLLESIGLERGDLDLVVGGPPCQGFSYIGTRDIADPRNNLVYEFARLCVEMRPRTLVMENVPGIVSMKTPQGGSVIDEFCRILERGDFGEFETLRQAMTGETRRAARRSPKKKGDKKLKTSKANRQRKEKPEQPPLPLEGTNR